MQPRSAKVDHCVALSELRVFFAVLKAWSGFVFGGENRLDADFQRPVDGKVGIIPAQHAFGLWIVRRGDFVVEIRRITHHQETMRTARRNVKAFVGISGQHISVPDSEGGRTSTQIDENIEHGAGGHPNQLSLCRISILIVQPAQNVLGRSAVVVLHEIKIEPDLAESLAVPRFEEESARVTEDLRLQKPRIVNFGL